MVLRRDENPTIRAGSVSCKPLPLSVIVIGTVPIRPSESWGMLRVVAKPKLYSVK